MREKDKKNSGEEIDIDFIMKYAGLGLLTACFFYLSQRDFNYRFLGLVIVALGLIEGSYLWRSLGFNIRN